MILKLAAASAANPIHSSTGQVAEVHSHRVMTVPCP